MQIGVFMTLTEQLKILLESYFEKYPHMSINALAKKSGVGASTLRRIMSGSQKGDPAPSTVLNIVSAASKERKLAVILKTVQGPIGEILNNSFGHFVEEDLPHNYNTDLNRELGEWPKYLIYKLASNKNGVFKQEIENILGKVGLKHLEDLFNLGLVFMEGEIIHAKEKNFSLDIILICNYRTGEVPGASRNRSDQTCNISTCAAFSNRQCSTSLHQKITDYLFKCIIFCPEYVLRDSLIELLNLIIHN